MALAALLGEDLGFELRLVVVVAAAVGVGEEADLVNRARWLGWWGVIWECWVSGEWEVVVVAACSFEVAETARDCPPAAEETLQQGPAAPEAEPNEDDGFEQSAWCAESEDEVVLQLGWVVSS